MSDFLSNLVTRSLTPSSDAVRPRLPSLFEPLAMVSGLTRHAPLEVALPGDFEQSSEVSTAPPTSSQNMDPIVHERRQRGPDEATLARQAASTGRLPEAESLKRPTVALSPNDITIAPQRVETWPVAKTSEIPPGRPLPIEVQPVIADRGETTERSRQLPQLASSLRQPLAAGDVLSRGEATGQPWQDIMTPSFPVPSPLEQRPSADRQPGVIQPPTTNDRLSITNHQPPIPRSQPPAPTIQVTIGRIEVRATPPPTPARRPRTEPTSTTLDEYLKRRASGDKR